MHRAWAQTVELHETINDGGVMKMRPVPSGFEVPATGALELKPGGKHVMLIGLTKPMVGGEEIEITLQVREVGGRDGEGAGEAITGGGVLDQSYAVAMTRRANSASRLACGSRLSPGCTGDG